MRCVLITGVAGFIGYSTARRLLDESKESQLLRVVGVDNLNPYYSVELKRSRVGRLSNHQRFVFKELDIADHMALGNLVAKERPEAILHFAAQAGVRYSLKDPFAYAKANLLGHLSVLEACRQCPPSPRLIYASSSSVYGANKKVPFAESDAVERPISLYAATKRADELMSETYSHLFGIEQIGLRFFSVYGPWGRPDMAYWTFTESILRGDAIPIFNNGNQKRDFTYIDDIVNGVLACLRQPSHFGSGRSHRIYNIGNNRTVPLMRFIEVLEDAIGRPAVRDLRPAQPGDVQETFADIDLLTADYGYRPETTIEEGLPKFVSWFRSYFHV
jgi:UDP-glucuronate 4-epimerase